MSRCEIYLTGSNMQSARIKLRAKMWADAVGNGALAGGSGAWTVAVGMENCPQSRRNLILWESFPIAWVKQIFNFHPYFLSCAFPRRRAVIKMFGSIIYLSNLQKITKETCLHYHWWIHFKLWKECGGLVIWSYLTLLPPRIQRLLAT